jgi:hypothetical protein
MILSQPHCEHRLKFVSVTDWQFHGEQVAMMSRITLNLRKQAFHGPNPHHLKAESFVMSPRNDATCTPSGEVVVLSRLRSCSVSSAARVESNNRTRSGSASSIVTPVRTITFAENSSISVTRPRLSTIFSAGNSPTTLSLSGSPLSEHVDWPSASHSDQRNTADIVWFTSHWIFL